MRLATLLPLATIEASENSIVATAILEPTTEFLGSLQNRMRPRNRCGGWGPYFIASGRRRSPSDCCASDRREWISSRMLRFSDREGLALKRRMARSMSERAILITHNDEVLLLVKNILSGRTFQNLGPAAYVSARSPRDQFVLGPIPRSRQARPARDFDALPSANAKRLT